MMQALGWFYARGGGSGRGAYCHEQFACHCSDQGRLPEPEQNHCLRPNLRKNSGMARGQCHGCCVHNLCHCSGLSWAIGRFYPAGERSQSWQCGLVPNRAYFVKGRGWRLALHQPQGLSGFGVYGAGVAAWAKISPFHSSGRGGS